MNMVKGKVMNCWKKCKIAVNKKFIAPNIKLLNFFWNALKRNKIPTTVNIKQKKKIIIEKESVKI